MLQMAARYADVWNAWSVNNVAAIAPLREAVDTACRDVGRDPSTLARTVAVLVDLAGHADTARAAWVTGLRSAFSAPATGTPDELAALLRGYASAGISHVQVWLEPTTPAAIESFAPVLGLLDRRYAT
jgi:alkanesulfonate monooxygenase SsuD/methylene tetrahydromethanopterin reductase-like flavin-dependent oxidoreductase (luciferase family)